MGAGYIRRFGTECHLTVFCVGSRSTQFSNYFSVPMICFSQCVTCFSQCVTLTSCPVHLALFRLTSSVAWHLTAFSSGCTVHLVITRGKAKVDHRHGRTCHRTCAILTGMCHGYKVARDVRRYHNDCSSHTVAATGRIKSI